MWKSNSVSGAPDNSSVSHFSVMTRPCWLRRAVRSRHRHAIEQASRRWRGGRRDDSARTRRKILISTQVVRMLGNGRCECYCFDGVTRLGHIRGKMRKKVWVSAGDIVLVGLREYQDDKAPEQRLTAATSTCNRRSRTGGHHPQV